MMIDMSKSNRLIVPLFEHDQEPFHVKFHILAKGVMNYGS
jgi:hypothetical protein